MQPCQAAAVELLLAAAWMHSFGMHTQPCALSHRRRWTCVWSARTAPRWRLRGGWRVTPRWGPGAAATSWTCSAIGCCGTGWMCSRLLVLLHRPAAALLHKRPFLPPGLTQPSRTPAPLPGAACALPGPGVAPRPRHCCGADDRLWRRGESAAGARLFDDGGRPTQQLPVGNSVGSWCGSSANTQLCRAVASCSCFLLHIGLSAVIAPIHLLPSLPRR